MLGGVTGWILEAGMLYLQTVSTRHGKPKERPESINRRDDS